MWPLAQPQRPWPWAVTLASGAVSPCTEPPPHPWPSCSWPLPIRHLPASRPPKPVCACTPVPGALGCGQQARPSKGRPTCLEVHTAACRGAQSRCGRHTAPRTCSGSSAVWAAAHRPPAHAARPWNDLAPSARPSSSQLAFVAADGRSQPSPFQESWEGSRGPGRSSVLICTLRCVASGSEPPGIAGGMWLRAQPARLLPAGTLGACLGFRPPGGRVAPAHCLVWHTSLPRVFVVSTRAHACVSSEASMLYLDKSGRDVLAVPVPSCLCPCVRDPQGAPSLVPI